MEAYVITSDEAATLLESKGKLCSQYDIGTLKVTLIRREIDAPAASILVEGVNGEFIHVRPDPA